MAKGQLNSILLQDCPLLQIVAIYNLKLLIADDRTIVRPLRLQPGSDGNAAARDDLLSVSLSGYGN
jgi:hypothetical protein